MTIKLFLRAWSLDVIFAVVLVSMLGVALFATREHRPVDSPTADASSLAGTLTQKVGSATLTIDSFAIGQNPPSLFPQHPAAPTIELPSSSSLTLAGWAVDTVAKSSPSGLLVQVDGEDRVAGASGIARPDVATALNMPGAGTSGFSATIPAALLPPGRHALSFLVVTSDRTSFILITRRLFVNVGS